MLPSTEPDVPALHTWTIGAGHRTVWVHGSMSNSARTWRLQRSLAARWLLTFVDRRGTPPSPPAHGNNFAVDARDIGAIVDSGAAAHLVAHSYGCIGAVLAAVSHADKTASLTLVEPPVFQLIDTDAATAAQKRFARLQSLESPSEFLTGFRETFLPGTAAIDTLDAETELLVRLAMNEQPPWTSLLPLAELRASAVPVLIVTGGHSQMFEDCADALAAAIGPSRIRRALVRGAGHQVPRAGAEFNELVEDFWRLVGQ